VKELEEKRINKEMANIRKKFKGQLFFSFQHLSQLLKQIRFKTATWMDIKRKSLLPVSVFLFKG